MDRKLSWKEGYRAAYGFLDRLWQEMSPEEQALLSELDGFLAGMFLQEDCSASDPAIDALWHQANARVTGGNGYGDLTGEEAYSVMLAFLGRWAQEHSDGTIFGILEELERTGPERDGWKEAVIRVMEGNFNPYFGLT